MSIKNFFEEKTNHSKQFIVLCHGKGKLCSDQFNATTFTRRLMKKNTLPFSEKT